MPAENKQRHDGKPICGAKVKNGERKGYPCESTILGPAGRCRVHGGWSPGAPKGNQNAEGHGAPAGNDNSRKHGLFSKSLGPDGLEVYEGTKELEPEALAREAANFAVAKIAEAFSGNGEVKGAVALVEAYLEGLVMDERITPDTKEFLMRRLTEPDIAAMGKALSPIKGLLEVKKPEAGEDGAKKKQIDEFLESVKKLKGD